MKPGETMILFGGGLDSGVLVERFAASRPFLLHISYGQKAVAGERAALHYFAWKHSLKWQEFDIPPLFPSSPLTNLEVVEDEKKHASNYIPGRNLLLASIAFSIASARGLRSILLGASPAPANSAFHDATQKFASLLNDLLWAAYPHHHVRGSPNPPFVYMPLVSLDRTEYIRETLAVAPELFLRTFTCYESTDPRIECGRCVHCQQKESLAKALGAATNPTQKSLGV